MQTRICVAGVDHRELADAQVRRAVIVRDGLQNAALWDMVEYREVVVC
jgi:hypothetical protein